MKMNTSVITLLLALPLIHGKKDFKDNLTKRKMMSSDDDSSTKITLKHKTCGRLPNVTTYSIPCMKPICEIKKCCWTVKYGSKTFTWCDSTKTCSDCHTYVPGCSFASDQPPSTCTKCVDERCFHECKASYVVKGISSQDLSVQCTEQCPCSGNNSTPSVAERLKTG